MGALAGRAQEGSCCSIYRDHSGLGERGRLDHTVVIRREQRCHRGEKSHIIDQIVMGLTGINGLAAHPQILWITLSKRFLTVT